MSAAAAPERAPRTAAFGRAAAALSLLVVLLGATGLFALAHTQARTEAALARLGDLHRAQVAAVEARVSFKTQVQEWKNLLLRGRDPADFADYQERFAQRGRDVQEDLRAVHETLAALGLDAGEADRLRAAHAALGERYRTAIAADDPRDAGAAFRVDASVRGIDR